MEKEKRKQRLVHGMGINDMYGWCCYNKLGTTHIKYRTYTLWKSVLARCSEKYQAKNPTYKGVTVCERWLRLSNFVEDIVNVEGYDMWRDNPNQFIALDKDTKIADNKVYGPEGCRFLTISESVADANHRRAPEVCNKSVKFPFGQRAIKEVFDDGSCVEYPSAGAAARALGLNRRNISACCEGRQKLHKGHKFRYA